MTQAYIALGSNLGKRQLALRAAIERIAKLPGTRLLAVADFRETPPVGGPEGARHYINGAVSVETDLSAAALLGLLLDIERALGRDRSHEVRNGPRTADLDLLLFGGAVIDEPGLTVPHPRMHERLFVLEPLAEIAPEVVHPVLQKTVAALLAERRAAEGGSG